MADRKRSRWHPGSPVPDVQVASSQLDSESFSFGPYRLLPMQRRLERAGAAVRLGDRAFDLLCALIERAGDLLTHRELMSRVWGNVVVGEGSLRFQINALRKALARDGSGMAYIRNVTRRGYTFGAPVRRAPVAPPDAGRIGVERGRLARRRPASLGREEEIREVAGLLGKSRFVTLVGPGGVGKTTVALEVAHGLRAQLDLVSFVELESIEDPVQVAGAVAADLGLVLSSASPATSLIAYLRDKRALLIFDSCERALESVAMLCEQILEECPHGAILATSQEALRAHGERTFDLAPLRVPEEGTQPTAAEALCYSAVALFVARARATHPHFQLGAKSVPDVVAICRNVDGIPLAIELAAGRVGTLALPEILALLSTRSALIWPGRRTAAERHRTLGAAIAWTVELLDDNARTVLRRLSIFTTAFTFEAAQRVAGAGLPPGSFDRALSDLVARSLVGATFRAPSTRFRLLGMTRVYAGRMLEDSGELAQVAQRHARHMSELVEASYGSPDELDRSELWHSHEVPSPQRPSGPGTSG